MPRISAPFVPRPAALPGEAVSGGTIHTISMLAAARRGSEGVHHAPTH
jgi:hypothetical protein